MCICKYFVILVTSNLRSSVLFVLFVTAFHANMNIKSVCLCVCMCVGVYALCLFLTGSIEEEMDKKSLGMIPPFVIVCVGPFQCVSSG